MKRITTLALILVISLFNMYSQNVSEKLATRVGLNFLTQQIDNNNVQQINLNTKVMINDTVLYYIFNINKDVGFLIVSGDKRYFPILAYSFEANNVRQPPPPAYKSLMKIYEEEIIFIKRNQDYQNSENLLLWNQLYQNRLSRSPDRTVDPLLTTTWNQGCYYNDSCPSDPTGACGHAYTGCVPTAMAQIMKFHNYPTSGEGSFSYNHWYYGYLSANFATTSYDWSNMANYLNSGSSSQEISAIAQLMYHCGVSCHVNYGTTSTGGFEWDVALALPLYFGYDPSIRVLRRSSVSSQQWIDTLKNELDESRPVFCTGSNSSSNHAWVCDGYQANDFFHFNWGWGGSWDGFYNINNINQGGNTWIIGNIIKRNTPYNNPPEDYTMQSINFALLGLSSAAFCDFDNDGDLDLINCGLDINLTPQTILYKNDGNNNFSEVTNSITDLCIASIAWADYNNDGYIDLAINGYSDFAYNNPVSKIYKNNNGSVFTDINANITNLGNGSISWSDIDNDGDYDLIVTGNTYGLSFDGITKVYENNGGDNFEERNISLIQVGKSSTHWGDYDNDNDFDLLISGFENNSPRTKIYKNEGDFNFSDIGGNLVEIGDGDAKWFDFDNDGDLDFVLSGLLDNNQDTAITKIYENINGDYSELSQNLIGIGRGTIDVGDFDNDGDLDILQTGMRIFDPWNYLSSFKICQNNSDGTFNQFEIIGDGISSGTAIWGDYDNDNDLDIYLSGNRGQNSRIAQIFKNETSVINTPPSIPNGLVTAINNDTVLFSWNRANDNETPQDILNYSLVIGEDSTSCNIVSPMANIDSGYRRIVGRGNACQDTSWSLSNFGFGNYFWSVQTMDAGWVGSDFASFSSFVYAPSSDFLLEDTACINQIIVISYIGNGNDTANYFWDFNNANIISGSGQGPYQVQWIEVGSKNVSLHVIENGASSDTTIQTIFIKGSPEVPNTPTGPDVLCEDGLNTNYYTNQVAGATSYNWELLPAEAGNTLGSDTICTIEWSDNFIGQCTLTVRSVNECGISPYSGELVINIESKPVFDIVSYPNDTAVIFDTISLIGDIDNVAYYWSTGDTTQTINIINNSGPSGGEELYWLEVINEYNCNYIDSIKVWFILPIDNSMYEFNEDFAVFPNPNSGNFFIKIGLQNVISTIKIYNTKGELISNIESSKINDNIIHCQLNYLSTGVYFLRLSGTGKEWMKKVIIY